MKKLFEEAKLGNLTLKNRLIRSATHEKDGADKGALSEVLTRICADLAQGGVSLIITGMMGVGPNGCLNDSMTKIYGDTFTPRFRQLADAVHKAGSKIMVQLTHCGVKAGAIDQGTNSRGPSDFTFIPDKPAKALTKDEIKAVVGNFTESAIRCKEAGADGVQIHGAHGYLLSQFLNPYFNKRTDEYGGGIENRARVVFEVYDAVRAAVGKDYPVWIKINHQDMTEPQMSGNESLWVCGELDKRGIDAIELSAGAGNDGKSSPSRRMKDGDPEGSYLDAALELADRIKAAVVSVGGYRTRAGCEAALNKGKVQALSMSRPLIAEPGLAKRWQGGDDSPSICVSCNKCFGVPVFGCPVFKK